jgi:hypothetical protein
MDSKGIRRAGATFVLSASLALPLVSTGSHGQSPSAPAAGAMSKLRLLYAGRPGSDREKDFVTFLKKHFDVVQTGNLETFKEADTQGVDVTLLDWDLPVLKGPCPALSENFSRPVITLGVHGSVLCSRWRLKMTYL